MASAVVVTLGNITDQMPVILLGVFVILATILIMAPVTRFLYVGWAFRGMH
jgi:hypothetical protein